MSIRSTRSTVLAMPAVRDQLIKSGAGAPFITTPQQFSDLLRADYDSYAKVIKEIGFKVD